MALLLSLSVLPDITDTADYSWYPVWVAMIEQTRGFLIVYDVTSARSFQYVEDIWQAIRTVKKTTDFPLVLVG